MDIILDIVLGITVINKHSTKKSVSDVAET